MSELDPTPFGFHVMTATENEPLCQYTTPASWRAVPIQPALCATVALGER